MKKVFMLMSGLLCSGLMFADQFDDSLLKDDGKANETTTMTRNHMPDRFDEIAETLCVCLNDLKTLIDGLDDDACTYIECIKAIIGDDSTEGTLVWNVDNHQKVGHLLPVICAKIKALEKLVDSKCFKFLCDLEGITAVVDFLKKHHVLNPDDGCGCDFDLTVCDTVIECIDNN